MERVKETPGEIRWGWFAEEFLLESGSGGISFDALRRWGRGKHMEEVGARLRSPMPRLGGSRRVNRSKS